MVASQINTELILTLQMFQRSTEELLPRGFAASTRRFRKHGTREKFSAQPQLLGEQGWAVLIRGKELSQISAVV